MSDQPVFVLMAGFPGTGKTTLANALREKLGWPVISKDFLKSSLIRADTGMTDDETGRVAYELLFYLARDFLVNQRFSLIFDTSAHRPFIVKYVTEVVAEARAEMKIIFCTASSELRRKRLEERAAARVHYPFMTQVGAIDIENDLNPFAHLPKSKLIVDTACSLEQCLEEALRYLLLSKENPVS